MLEMLSTKQQRIAQVARKYPDEPILALNHYLDEDWLREAYKRLRKDSATGVDGMTVEAYGKELDVRLPDLLNRAKSGSYFAPPAKRINIPKGKVGETRPISIPTTEDKLLQRAIKMLIEPIYEEEFYEFSHGFRPGRSQHAALDQLWKQIMDIRTGWIVDVDIRKYFDTVNRQALRGILHQRVRDGVVTKLIDKWLKAGVMEDGLVSYPEIGVPQGSVISPLLSNIYLHEVLDKWFAEVVSRHIKGRCFMMRFADDVVAGFENKDDAEKFYRTLPKRLEKYGLRLHPEKTKLVPFGQPGKTEAKGPGKFNFLGFTHYWGKSRKGTWVVMRKTMKERLARSLKEISQWCMKNRHMRIREQHRKLCQKVQGHYAYYGITGNARSLESYLYTVKRIWRKWLNRRSRGRKNMTWERFGILLSDHLKLPSVRIVHSCYSAKP